MSASEEHPMLRPADMGCCSRTGQSSRWSYAKAVAAARDETPSLAKMLVT